MDFANLAPFIVLPYVTTSDLYGSLNILLIYKYIFLPFSLPLPHQLLALVTIT